MSKRVELLIIDPQVDFCDPKLGSLYVGGAEQDIARLTTMVDRLAPKLDDIHVTLDSHHLVDIAHPIWWRNSKGEHPNPFTQITAAEVENGEWTTTVPSLLPRSLAYLKQLEATQRYPFVIWPPHCRIGSQGATVMPDLFDALTRWEGNRFGLVDYVTKGSNIYTEHYSAIRAEVPDPKDPTTQVNTQLIQTLMEADLILVAGEAGSHCLANTVRDIATEFGDDKYVSKLILLQDATSPVGGFEFLQDNFVTEMVARGMQLSTTVDVLS